jgi:hypothetical protein
LAGWAPDEALQLVALLRRLNDDLDAVRPHLGRLFVGRPPDGTPAPSASSDRLPDPRLPVQENA